MARQRNFERETALNGAMQLFWAKGFAATSTDDLLQTMGIGRQSFYNAFGSKREAYLEALGRYLEDSTGVQLRRLNTPASPLGGISKLLLDLAVADPRPRSLGCMGVCSIGEFGLEDAGVSMLRERASRLVVSHIVRRVVEGQALGEIDAKADAIEAASFVQLTLNGLQVAARGGATRQELEAMATFAIGRLVAR